jgi:hypothetical protein
MTKGYINRNGIFHLAGMDGGGWFEKWFPKEWKGREKPL